MSEDIIITALVTIFIGIEMMCMSIAILPVDDYEKKTKEETKFGNKVGLGFSRLGVALTLLGAVLLFFNIIFVNMK